MGKNVLTISTTAAASVIWATLVSAPLCFTHQVHEIQADSKTPFCEASPIYDFSTIVDTDIALRIKFETLREEWRNQRGAMSSVTAMSMLRPYQKIIGIGSNAIPLILAELRADGDDPDQWFWALSIIAEANNLTPPEIAPAHQGDYRAMALAWLDWGRVEGYAR
jgi:hypothetical protein